MKFSLAILAGLFAGASAGNMGNCDEQASCMEFTIEENDGGDCGDTCYYEVCMIYSNFPQCPKGGDAYSHTCLKDPSTCQDATGFALATKYESGGVLKAGGTQCQKIAPGNTAEFYIKDGNEVCGAHTKYYDLDHVYTATCDDLVDLGISNCGGNAEQHKACVWRVDVPVTCTDPPVVTDAPVPNECEYFDLNFDSLARGEYITNQFEATHGIEISCSGGLYGCRTFDSSIPYGEWDEAGAVDMCKTGSCDLGNCSGKKNDCGDPDLGTPNNACTNTTGFGEGSGGRPGQPGEICWSLGNFLVIDENGPSYPPDDRVGGTVHFTFTNGPVDLVSVDHMDNELAEHYTINVSL